MDRGRGRYRRGGGNHGRGRHYTPRGRSQRSAGTWVARGGAGAGAYPDEASSGSGSSEVESRSSEVASVDGVTKKFGKLTSQNPSGNNSESFDSLNVSPNDGNSKVVLQNVSGTEPKSSGNGSSEVESRSSEVASVDGVTKKFGKLTSENPSGHNSESFDSLNVLPNDGNLKVALQNLSGSEPKSSGSGSSEVESRSCEVASVDGVTKKFGKLTSENPSGHNSESFDSLNVWPNDGNSKVVLQNVSGTEPKSLNAPSTGPYHGIPFPSLSTNSELDVVRTGLCSQSRDQDVENQSPANIISTPLQTVGGQFSPEAQSGKTSSEGTSGKTKLDKPDSQDNKAPFDICKEKDCKVVMLKPSLFQRNKELRDEKRRMQGDNIQTLRPGMILLKGYLSPTDQVKLVKSCRDLGMGPGGFYEPGYRDGAKLFLKMMCLGKNWDPQTSKYDDTRPTDQAKPPPIPNEFQRLVKEAIQKCHRYLESDCNVMDPSKHLPLMSPDICIINFYSSSGKLGLHQDKHESQESLQKRLPVVSFSVGDTAEFQFGEKRDVDEAHKVQLKSGDVLIFGGESRHIFHGVSKIIKDTAPEVLLKETYLKPGRLNLTFRQY